MRDTTQKRAIVIGAGIVGVCTGLELLKRGWAVTIVDRLEPGEGCSFGNAGILAAQAVVPVGMPGIMKDAPKMLLDREGPLVVRFRSLPKTIPWLLHMRRAATAERVSKTADAMKALNGTTVELHEAIAREAGVPDLLKPYRYLYVHRDASKVDVDNALAWRLRRERGGEIEVLTGQALRDAEPELATDYQVGVRLGPMAFTLNPFRLTQSYAKLFAKRGGEILKAEVRALKPRGAIVDVETSAGIRQAQTVTITAGAWSRELVRPLGLDIPLIAERGYHMTFPKAGIGLNHVISEAQHQFAVTPMEMGLRVAGTEELGHADEPPAWRRAEVLKRHAARMFPRANLEDGTRWMGPRPGTPDSLPFIGPLPNHPNIFIAAGHGHLGLTGGPNTGRIVAALASGERLNIPLEPYSPTRFGSASSARAKATAEARA
ncbi:MAG: NAD(P)/FAD-dependent oxidoreductase [Hyphomicrobiaceae bacterium]